MRQPLKIKEAKGFKLFQPIPTAKIPVQTTGILFYPKPQTALFIKNYFCV
jgi:hypothetical protein